MSTEPGWMETRGRIAGRPMEEWNAAYGKVESYLHALRVRNKVLLGELVQRVLERAMARAPAEPDRSPTELAAEEMDRLLTEWFAEVLERIPTGVEQLLSTKGRLALLLTDMPGKWQDQFLHPGPWPEEFVDRHARNLPARRPGLPDLTDDAASAGFGADSDAHQFQPSFQERWCWSGRSLPSD